MTAPMRIQLSRRRGWRMPENSTSVARPGRWGNPFCDFRSYSLDLALALFRELMSGVWNPATVEGYSDRVTRVIYDNHQRFRRRLGCHPAEAVRELRGRNLACWCVLCAVHAAGKPLGVECGDCAPCHADILLEIANG